MKNQHSRALWAATAAIIPFALVAPTAMAQDSGMQQQIQQSIAANQQRLAHYSWQEQSRSPTWCIPMWRPTRKRCSRLSKQGSASLSRAGAGSVPSWPLRITTCKATP